MRDLSALPDLNLALIQTSLAWHDRQANLEHFDALLEQARGADLIILPEMFTTGFSMESETLAEAENGPTSKWLRIQAAKLNAVVTGGERRVEVEEAAAEEEVRVRTVRDARSTARQ